MEQKISYLAKDYHDYKNEFLNITKKYYPNMQSDFQDASIGSWFMDLIAAASDNLSSHIDKTFQETNIGSASEKSSILSLARSNGLKIPGRKASMTEVVFTCELPVNPAYSNGEDGANLQSPGWDYAPIIKKGTMVSSGQYKFEVMEDIDFSKQFNSAGVSDRTILPKRNANGVIELYTITKTAIVLSGESKIYKKVISSNDIVPFMEVMLPDLNVMNIESIIFKDSTDYKSDPTINEFMIESEYMPAGGNTAYGLKVPVWRYFEVDSLAEQYRFGDVLSSDGLPVIEKNNVYGLDEFPTIVKGEWKPLRQKFITEFTDKNYLKIIFGAGYNTDIIPSGATSFGKFIMSRIINNDALGVLPNPNWTMYVLYRVGGGAETNIAKGAINNISYLNVSIGGTDQTYIAAVKASIRVVNTIPSVSGKDAPSENEIKYLIKYNNSSQNRCVTVKDYYARIMQMPPKYGCPFRVGVIEQNNCIVMFLLGIDSKSKLTTQLPDQLVENIQRYLSQYRMINDYVVIRSGKIINLAFEVDIYVSKNYNVSDVVKLVIETIQEYMDINKHQMGEDIYISNLEKEISQLDGVLNLIDLRVYNKTDDGYSKTESTQPGVVEGPCETSNVALTSKQIDLDASDGILYSNSDTMFEIKYPSRDIKIKVKTR